MNKLDQHLQEQHLQEQLPLERKNTSCARLYSDNLFFMSSSSR